MEEHTTPTVKELSELFSPYVTTQSKGNQILIRHYPTPHSCHTYLGDVSFPLGENGWDSKGQLMEKHVIPSEKMTPKHNLVLTKQEL